MVRRVREGRQETWWAADLIYGPDGPDPARRVVVATTDPATLPPLTTWCLSTNLPRPGAPHADEALFAPADLTEVVRLYGLRNWVEQGDKQLKQELGWAAFMVRSDQAIRRHMCGNIDATRRTRRCSMTNGVLDERLQHHRRDSLRKGVGRNFPLDA